ncbi:aminotransferase class I/II-fold pyridoxal phosphate-dependent enzyme, partial [Rhizobium ruizarguesonis]
RAADLPARLAAYRRNPVAGGIQVAVPCHEQTGFKLRHEDLEAAITPRTKWLFLNFQNNPTGAACSGAEMAAIAEVMLRH